MSLTGALFSGVRGIGAHGTAMDIIGDNIANVNTVGFKSTRAVFADLLSTQVGGVKVGAGSRVAAAQRLFIQGSVETTQSLTDLSVQGRGFFVLKDANGKKFYTRAGQFSTDKTGALTNAQGLRVQGVQLNSSGQPISGLTDIIINNKLLAPPIATGTNPDPTFRSVSLTLNLDATAATPASALPADAAGTEDTAANWFAASNFSTVVTIFDSLGQAHDLTFLFRKTAANQWEYRVVANAAEISGGTAGMLQQVSAAGGQLVFNPDGTLDSASSTITQIGPIAWTNGANAQTIAATDILFPSTTQFALPSAVTSITQDGAPTRNLTGISIDQDGILSGLFSSGKTQPLFQIVLADFTNPEGLAHVGNTLFEQSPKSGEALLGNPGMGGLGTVLSGTLELSTVDLSAEFVRMVTVQRGFQSSARTITVTDTLLEEVINLKR